MLVGVNFDEFVLTEHVYWRLETRYTLSFKVQQFVWQMKGGLFKSQIIKTVEVSITL